MSQKRIAKRRSLASGQGLDSQDPSVVTPDAPYVCCGRFFTDFARVCAERGLPYVPEVVPRAWPPFKTEAQAQKKAKEMEQLNKGKKVMGKGYLTLTKKDSMNSFPGSMKKISRALSNSTHSLGSSVGRPPRTFVTKDNLQYAKPRIQVELEVADDDRTVTETHIREWQVDGAMMEVLSQCWPALTSLHTLHLWNTGLDSPALQTLALCLPRCLRLTTLSLDNNPLTDLPLASLLGPDSPLESLSLRWCGIGDSETRAMALALGSPNGPNNTTLQSLNLANNSIGDVGLRCLAEALTMNWNLLALNVSSNRVRDEGAGHLAEALSWFHVGEEWLKIRRVLMHEELARCLQIDISVPVQSKKRQSHNSILEKGTKVGVSRAGGGRGGVATASPLGPGGGGKALPVSCSKDKLMLKKEATGPSSSSNSANTSRKKDVLVQRSKKKSMAPSVESLGCRKLTLMEMEPGLRISRPLLKPAWSSEEDTEVLSYGSHHPLLQAGYLHQGELWLPGNRSLISLDLSRNSIGEQGLGALLEAVKEQVIPSGDQGERRGLLRLVVSRNAVSADNPVAVALGRMMALRDPLFRCPNIDLRKDSICPCAIPLCAF